MHELIAKDGNKYFIDLDDGENITVFDSNQGQVGSITLMYVNGDDWKSPSYFYLQKLDLKGCTRLGIGTEVFRLHNKIFGEPITAAKESGSKMYDGSHLIDDGIPFVAKMREKGLICAESIDEEFMDDDY
jgi:hypothetical protein